MRFPYSLALIVLSLGLYWLQHFPAFGLPYLLLAGPAWPIVFINGGLLGTGVETFVRSLSRAWLILPVVWFGGGATLAAYDRAMLLNLQHELAATNDAVRIPFDPAKQALVGGDDFELKITHFKLPVTYELSDIGSLSYFASRPARRSVCEHIRQDPFYRVAGITALGFAREGDHRGAQKFVSDLCIVRTPEEPLLPIVEITERREKIEKAGLSVMLRHISVVTSGGRRYRLTGGWAEVHHWIPMPVMGCGLNSANPSWDCGIGFLGTKSTPILTGSHPLSGETAALSKALGLSPQGRFPYVKGSDDALLRHFEQVRQNRVRMATQTLDAIIADPTAKIDNFGLDVLQYRADIVVPRVPAMLSAIERNLTLGSRTLALRDDVQNASGNAEVLFDVLERAQLNDVLPYWKRIQAIQVQNRSFRFEHKSHPVFGGQVLESTGDPIIVEKRR